MTENALVMSDGEIVLHESAPLPSLMDGPDPMLAVGYARRLSEVLMSVLTEGNGYVTISGRKHVEIAGWATLAAMTDHTCEIEWSRMVPGLGNDKGVEAWEARAIVRDGAGRVVAHAESMAEPGEGGPWGKSNHAVRGMAQTRARVRAYADRLRYITVLAGMSGTPAEEMRSEGGGGSLPTIPVWQERQASAEARLKALDATAVPAKFFTDLGVDHPSKLAGKAVWKKVDDELTKREAAATPIVNDPDNPSEEARRAQLAAALPGQATMDDAA